MSVKARYRNGMIEYFDPQQQNERVGILAPYFFYDDFDGKVILTGAGNWWGTRTVGTPGAAAVITPSIAGVARLPIAATSESETNNLDFNDVLIFQKNLGLIVEARVRLH